MRKVQLSHRYGLINGAKLRLKTKDSVPILMVSIDIIDQINSTRRFYNQKAIVIIISIDIGVKLVLKCENPGSRDSHDNFNPPLNALSTSFRISDTFQIRSDECTLTQIEVGFQVIARKLLPPNWH